MIFFYALAVLTTVGVAAITLFSRSGEQEKGSAEKGPSSVPAKAAALPKDVYPDSMARLPLIKREEMDERGKKLYDLFGSRRLAPLPD